MKSKMNPCCDKEFQDDNCASGLGSNSRVKEARRLSQRDEPGGTNRTRLLFRNMGKVEALVCGAQKLRLVRGGSNNCCFYVEAF